MIPHFPPKSNRRGLRIPPGLHIIAPDVLERKARVMTLHVPRLSLVLCLLAALALLPLSPAGAEDAALTAPLTLPWDLSPGPEPDPAGSAGDTYADPSIRVRLETREEEGVIWHLAFVRIASPAQLRTYTADPGNLLSRRTASVSKMARAAHAVVAINGDFYNNDAKEASVEYRMGQKVRYKAYRQKDVLLIDDRGDFHLILAGSRQTNAEQLDILADAFSAHHVINAFTFGPALVVDGRAQAINPHYSYTPNRKDPRSAIGQLGSLSYVLAVAEGRGASSGATMQELADYMAALGCLQAYNLDGGNSSQLVFGDTVLKGQPTASDRTVNDILYFASAMPDSDAGGAD